jgi:drug/metabolite transporter (DMT)-like permease
LVKRKIALQRSDIPWLVGAVVAGGVIGPVLLMMGLARSSAASASLLLNLEGVFTALLAWFAFKENFDRRVALGMALIVAGGALLALEPGALRDGYAGAMVMPGRWLCRGSGGSRRLPGMGRRQQSDAQGVGIRCGGDRGDKRPHGGRPFVGVGLALVAWGETPTPLFWPAAALMVAGVWLHISERHEHQHIHEPIEHEHGHVHDEHHRHH